MKCFYIILLYTIVTADGKFCERTIDLSNGILLTSGKVELNGIMYDPGDDIIGNSSTKTQGCKCDKQNCYRKCCPPGYAYNIPTKKCVETLQSFQPSLWDQNALTDKNISTLHPLYGIVDCNLQRRLRFRVKKIEPSFNLLTNGQLFIPTPHSINKFTELTVDEYCVDNFITYNDNGTITAQLDALACFPQDDQDNVPKGTIYFKTACLLISSLFIVVTLAVYLWLPELRVPPHGLLMMSYLTSLLLAFLTFAIIQISLLRDTITGSQCVTLSLIFYFLMLSSFFWLNVMCFNMYRSFSRNEHGVVLDRRTKYGQFYTYAAYAILCPLALTILVVSLEFADIPTNPYLPKLHIQGCFLFGTSKLIYFHTPMLLVCISNIVFFLLTASKISQVKKEASAAFQNKESGISNERSDHRSDNQTRFIILRLFCVMGVSWLLEVTSTFIYPQSLFWLITDAYNILIGVVIFIIFICKKRTFELIKRRISGFWDQVLSMKEITNWGRKTNEQSDRPRSSLDTIPTIKRRNIDVSLSHHDHADFKPRGPDTHEQLEAKPLITTDEGVP